MRVEEVLCEETFELREGCWEDGIEEEDEYEEGGENVAEESECECTWWAWLWPWLFMEGLDWTELEGDMSDEMLKKESADEESERENEENDEEEEEEVEEERFDEELFEEIFWDAAAAEDESER